MRLGFCGSPALAVPVLDALADAHDVALVVSRPDRRRGRGGRETPTPVKVAARRLGIPVAEEVGALRGAHLDLGVVVAYGALVPGSVLDDLAMLNLHLSLLPRWRGAAPVERAILAGDVRTGVCVMGLEATLDTGPIYASASTEVGDKDAASLTDELVVAGTNLLLGVLAAGLPLPEPAAQQGEATYAAKVTDAELELDFARPATDVARVVRLGRARTWAGARRLVVRRATVVDARGAPGDLLGDVVACGAGGLLLDEVVPEGRRPMSGAAWRRGLRDGAPSHLGRRPDP
jgi:methionyl-tRNA formyltransferase